ncbi:MAG TPA: hypothetical protein DCG47_11035 [Spirochaetaceae bacterium]|jgi:hypothetical protein|nr:hypothetical protein [Spirochaetaceae bacterium]
MKRLILPLLVFCAASAFGQALPWAYPGQAVDALDLLPAIDTPANGSGFLERQIEGISALPPAALSGWVSSYGFAAGLVDKTLFLLPGAAWAGLFRAEEGPDAFLGFRLAIGRDQILDVDADNYAVLIASAGFLGYEPLPWLLRGAAVYDLRRDIYPSVSLELSAELGSAWDVPLRLYPRLYGDYTSGPTVSSGFGAGLSALYLGMAYEGALPQGVAAAAELQAGFSPLAGTASWSLSLATDARLRPLSILSGGMTLWARASSAPYADWAQYVRGVGDYTKALAGSAGVAASAELCLLAARGTLLKNEDWDLDALLSGFVDLAYAGDPSRQADDPANRLLGAGLQFSLVVPNLKRNGLRVGAALDLSSLLRGTELAIISEDLELFAVVSLQL